MKDIHVSQDKSCNCTDTGHNHAHTHSHAHSRSHKSSGNFDGGADIHESTGCSCSSGAISLNKNDHETRLPKNEMIRLAICALLLAGILFSGFGHWTEQPPGISFWVSLLASLCTLLLTGGPVFLQALKNIARGQIFDENFLMAVASIGAFAIGDASEGIAVMLFYQIGELFQESAASRSRRSIADLMDIRPDSANLLINGQLRTVSPEEIEIGQLFQVAPGERIPLDGIIVEGRSTLDTSSLTGESLPKDVEKGDEVLSGSINQRGLLTVKATRRFEQSTVAKILNLVENAGARKAPMENFITKFARYYTPAVVGLALLIALFPPLITGQAFSEWIHRGLIFLVISCPCALVISIPLSFFGGIGNASRQGILVKGGNYLEALARVDTVVFDKTGTLTKGNFKVVNVRTSDEYAPSGITEEQLLDYTACAEAYSTHPIAQSILTFYGKEVERSRIAEYTELSGLGVSAVIDGHIVLAGNKKLMEKHGISIPPLNDPGTKVYTAIDNQYAGFFVITDELKEDSASAISGLKNMGVDKTVMLTGDAESVAGAVAAALNVDEYHSGLLPDQKVEQLERLYESRLEKYHSSEKGSLKSHLIFVGDGINDAPVLARADVGVAMGGLGSDAAIEAADVVIMTDEPSKLVTALKIARYTRKIVWQNIAFALGVKGLFLLLGALGLANMWEAVFADVGVALLAVLNSMRLLRLRA